jgi:hypothetical protein
VGANLRQNFHAITSRQSKIEQDEVEGMLSDPLQASFAADCGFHRETFHLEQCLQGFANFGFVINDKDRAR